MGYNETPTLKGKPMLLIALITTMLIGFICGITAERKVNKRKLEILIEAHKAEILKTHHSAFDSAWHAASSSPGNIKDRYEEIFGPRE